MKRPADRNPPRPRSAKKTMAAPPAVETPAAEATPVPLTGKNVGGLEGGLSMAAGVLFLVGALFPRTFKQLFLLSAGGFLFYRGMTGKCGIYKALAIDTRTGRLLK